MHVMMGMRGVEVVAGWLFGVAELYGWLTVGSGANLGGGQWRVGWGSD
jgi:hypothetical protein